jgi:hypothetical protein
MFHQQAYAPGKINNRDIVCRRCPGTLRQPMKDFKDCLKGGHNMGFGPAKRGQAQLGQAELQRTEIMAAQGEVMEQVPGAVAVGIMNDIEMSL